MQTSHRLKENRDFRRVFQRGKSMATGRLVLYWCDSRHPTFRVGFSVSKKIGNAVTRNRLKRVLRECFHKLEGDLSVLQVDFVVICRQAAAQASFHEIEADVRKLLRKAKFVVS
ncbi:MAG: ribonuclease P protein component [Alicyclobacillus sp.]|nr:ribonuclease P protein component [Alicyclobacillus sp.]